MIYFVTRYYKGTINEFIDSWAGHLRTQVRVIRYREIPFLKSVSPGAYIFADLERLRPWENFFAKKLSRRLKNHSEKFQALNNPNHYLGKFELLKILHRRGINDFQVYRLNELNQSTELKFPVFIRRDDDHRGSVGGLLHSRSELNSALSKLSLRDRFQKKRLMVVEYCDCSDADRTFRKYSATNINGALIPSHIYFSKQWLTKIPDLITESHAAEEMDFVQNFPHEKQIAKVFQLAGLTYGRVDYGVKNGRVQIWEINTNPIIVRPRETMDPKRLSSQTQSARWIAEAFVAAGKTQSIHGKS